VGRCRAENPAKLSLPSKVVGEFQVQLVIGPLALPVRLDPASVPRRSNALAALCVELSHTQTRYPGTDLTLAYSVKDHPGIT